MGFAVCRLLGHCGLLSIQERLLMPVALSTPHRPR